MIKNRFLNSINIWSPATFSSILYANVFFGYFKNLDPGPGSGPWTWTLNPDPEKPGPWEIWTQKNLDSEKPGLWKTWTLKNLDSEKPGLWKTRETAGCKKKKIRRPHDIIYQYLNSAKKRLVSRTSMMEVFLKST